MGFHMYGRQWSVSRTRKRWEYKKNGTWNSAGVFIISRWIAGIRWALIIPLIFLAAASLRWKRFFIFSIHRGDWAYNQLLLLTASVGLWLLKHSACLRHNSAGGDFNDLGRIVENLYRTSEWFRCDLFLNFCIVRMKFIVKNLILWE